MSTKDLIVYDLDGTLVDTREDICQAVNHMLGQLGEPLLPVEEVQRSVGDGLPTLVRRALRSDDPDRLARGMKVYRAFYTRHMLDHSRVYPNAREVLDYFSGRRQVVITNKPDPYSRAMLEALGVAGRFSDIIAGNSGYPKKPDATAIRALMAREGVQPDRTVLVGDSPIDVETGRNAAVVTVGITHGFSTREELAAARPDVLVSSFQELLELARAEGW